ncbi:MAG: glycosyltransferase family 2 protein [Bacteroidetes bacterium]|nr:glycosyltransferase family 2 protein [Bacteroidota bacterium]
MDISVVVPLYNEEESIAELVDWIDKVMNNNNFSYEIIIIDDGSNDSSWQIINNLEAKNTSVKGIKFRRNYGKSAALYSGFEVVKGDVVITMDADLQDSPDEIPSLYKMIIDEDYDLVSGWKKKRHDPISKTIPSKFFNFISRKLTGIKLHDFNCGLKAYKNDLVKNIEVYGEMHRYIPILAKQAGFDKIGEKVVHHYKRKYGVTKFGLERFINGFLDLLSITFITKFGKRPMHLFGTLGTLMFFLGFIAALWLGIHKLYCLGNGLEAGLVTDSPYFYISLTTMIMGTLLFLAGFVAELVSRNSPKRNSYQIENDLNKK